MDEVSVGIGLQINSNKSKKHYIDQPKGYKGQISATMVQCYIVCFSTNRGKTNIGESTLLYRAQTPYYLKHNDSKFNFIFLKIEKTWIQGTQKDKNSKGFVAKRQL